MRTTTLYSSKNSRDDNSPHNKSATSSSTVILNALLDPTVSTKLNDAELKKQIEQTLVEIYSLQDGLITLSETKNAIPFNLLLPVLDEKINTCSRLIKARTPVFNTEKNAEIHTEINIPTIPIATTIFSFDANNAPNDPTDFAVGTSIQKNSFSINTAPSFKNDLTSNFFDDDELNNPPNQPMAENPQFLDTSTPCLPSPPEQQLISATRRSSRHKKLSSKIIIDEEETSDHELPSPKRRKKNPPSQRRTTPKTIPRWVLQGTRIYASSILHPLSDVEIESKLQLDSTPQTGIFITPENNQLVFTKININEYHRNEKFHFLIWTVSSDTGKIPIKDYIENQGEVFSPQKIVQIKNTPTISMKQQNHFLTAQYLLSENTHINLEGVVQSTYKNCQKIKWVNLATEHTLPPEQVAKLQPYGHTLLSRSSIKRPVKILTDEDGQQHYYVGFDNKAYQYRQKMNRKNPQQNVKNFILYVPELVEAEKIAAANPVFNVSDPIMKNPSLFDDQVNSDQCLPFSQPPHSQFPSSISQSPQLRLPNLFRLPDSLTPASSNPNSEEEDSYSDGLGY